MVVELIVEHYQLHMILIVCNSYNMIHIKYFYQIGEYLVFQLLNILALANIFNN